MSRLPPVLALQAPGGVSDKTQYLRLLISDNNWRHHRALEVSADEVLNPYAKFAVETASSNRELVHIRSSYNNRYWVVRAAEGNNAGLITADADEPEEDQSNSSCTLFRPVFQQDGGAVQFLHVNLNCYVGFFGQNVFGFASQSLVARASVESITFSIIDYDSLVVLPRRVAFKSLTNGNYAAPQLAALHARILSVRFGVSDAAHATVVCEVSSNPDGSIQIKFEFGGYWTAPEDWILLTSFYDSNLKNSYNFWPVKLGNSTIALRSLQNNNFCKIDSGISHGIGMPIEFTDTLRAIATTIDQDARLEVSEAIISRSVDVEFRLSDARIYDRTVLTMGRGYAPNPTNESATLSVSVSYTETKSRSWNAGVSLTLGYTFTINSGIPLILSTTMAISGSISGEYSWGQVQETSSTFETNYQVAVPPMSAVTVSAIGFQAKCDVPFSYVQRDVLNNGDRVTTVLEDGMYTGVNAYDVHFDVTVQQLDRAKVFIN